LALSLASSRFLDFWFSGFLVFWISGFLGIAGRAPCVPCSQKTRNPENQKSRNQTDFWFSGNPEIQKSD